METRDELLGHARDLFVEQGLHGFSMRRVAERAGLSATAIYRHYTDKDALLAAVLEEGFSQFGAYLMRALVGKTPLERLRLTGRAYFAFAFEHSRDYVLMFMTDTRAMKWDHLGDSTRECIGGTFQFLVDRIRECMDEGDFRPADPVTAAVFVWSQTHGLASLRLASHMTQVSDSEFERLIEACLDKVERALSPN